MVSLRSQPKRLSTKLPSTQRPATAPAFFIRINRLSGTSHGCAGYSSIHNGSSIMLRWALIFLVIAIVAALLGLGGVADFAMFLAYGAGIIFLILLVLHLVGGRRV